MGILFDSILSESPLVIGHRGAPHLAHENTVESFTHAIDLGVDAIEIDVRRTVDGVLVIHHDDTIMNQSEKISGLTYAQVLRGSKKEGFSVPTLMETLELCRDRTCLDIELKESGYELEVYTQVKEHFELRNVLFNSFIDESVLKLTEIDNCIEVGLLLGAPPSASFPVTFSELFPFKRICVCKAKFVSAHWKLLRFGFLKRMKRTEIPVLVWTVDDIRRVTTLAKQNVEGIITNIPDKVIQALSDNTSV